MSHPWRALPPVTPEPATLLRMPFTEAMALYRANGRPFSFVDMQGIVRTIIRLRHNGPVVGTHPWIGRAHYAPLTPWGSPDAQPNPSD